MSQYLLAPDLASRPRPANASTRSEPRSGDCLAPTRASRDRCRQLEPEQRARRSGPPQPSRLQPPQEHPRPIALMVLRQRGERFKCDAGIASFGGERWFRYKSLILVRLIVTADTIRLKNLTNVFFHPQGTEFSVARSGIQLVRLARIDAGGFERAIYMGVHLDFLGQLVLRDGTVHPTAFILGDDDLFPLLEYGRRMDWPTRLLSARVPSPMTGPREFFLKADLE